jgi:hypothetical protein
MAGRIDQIGACEMRVAFAKCKRDDRSRIGSSAGR